MMNIETKSKGVTLTLDMDEKETEDFRLLLREASKYWESRFDRASDEHYADICAKQLGLAQKILEAVK